MPIFPQKSVIAEESPWFKGKDVATSLDYTNPRKALLDHIDEDDKKTYLELWQGRHVSLLPLNQQPQPFLQMLEKLRQQQELEAEQHHQWPWQQFLVKRLPTPQKSPRVKFTWKGRGNESPFHSVRSLRIKKVVNLWQFKAVQNIDKGGVSGLSTLPQRRRRWRRKE